MIMWRPIPLSLIHILFLRGKVSPDTGFDTAKLEEFDRVVDVTEQLSPDYDYEKLKENYKATLLGNYIEEMERRRCV